MAFVPRADVVDPGEIWKDVNAKRSTEIGELAGSRLVKHCDGIRIGYMMLLRAILEVPPYKGERHRRVRYSNWIM